MLTRFHKALPFKNEYDQELPFSDCDGLGLYVHIPFCRSICSFCPYCKTLYSEEACSRYIDALIREIHLAGSQIPGKKTVTSLYFGGGTPALAADRIKEIIDAIQEHFIITQGIGIELHPENVTPRTLHILKEAGIHKAQHRDPVLPGKIPEAPGPDRRGHGSAKSRPLPGPL